MKKILKLILIVFLLPLNAQHNKQDIAITDSLSIELSDISKQGRINGFSVAIVNKDGVLYNQGFGFSDIKTKSKYTKNTIQNIGSISKTFIGLALMKAQEQGMLKLDDPINQYLPFKIINPYFPNQPITIRHLATHTSSIKDSKKYWKNSYILKEDITDSKVKVPSYFLPKDKKISMHDFFKNCLVKNEKWYSKKAFFKNKPGEFFEYSNMAAALAAFIIEKATGKDFMSYTNEVIFEPLKMTNTGWSFDAINFSLHSKLYHKPQVELAFYNLVTYPDGGLKTSSNDLSKYLLELIKGCSGNGTLLKKESYKELFTKQLSGQNYKERNAKSKYNDEYNIGIFMGFSAKGYIGHTGGDPGIAAFMFFNENSKLGKILIINTELDKESLGEFKDIWNKLDEYETKITYD